jgi:heterogeneous nuclear ribonucleoprotein L
LGIPPSINWSSLFLIFRNLHNLTAITMDSDDTTMSGSGGFQARGPPAKRSRGEGGMNRNSLERNDDKIPPNHILLITVMDAKYPVNVEVMHKVCSIVGPVNKIVCFERQTVVQAMVEYETLENSSHARTKLHGCDIYNNCCTMKVEYSKMEALKVRENGHMMWDFTQDRYGYDGGPPRPVVLNEPEFGGGPMMGGRGGDFMRGGESMGDPRSGARYGEYGEKMGYEKSSVVIVHNLAVGEVNCDRLFNLMCQYGNVSKIFFMKTKEGCAMVEMGDWEQAQRLCSNLNNVELFGNKLQLDLSKKHMKITNMPMEWELPDGSSSVKDFFSSGRLNRFTTPDMARKNRILPPTKVVHFYGIPKITDEEIEEIFSEYCAPQPNKIKWVEPRKPIEGQEKPENANKPTPGMGLAYFDSVAAATEALVLVNHREVEGKTIKLCFSRATY